MAAKLYRFSATVHSISFDLDLLFQAVLVASRKSLIQRKGVLDITHEMLERLEAHLKAMGQFTVRSIPFVMLICFCLFF